MITLTVPNSEPKLFVAYGSIAAGPLVGSTSQIARTILIETPGYLDEDSSSMYGEKGVMHEHYQGSLELDLIASCITSSPTSSMPCRMSLLTKTGERVFSYGLGASPHYGAYTTGSYWYHASLEIQGSKLIYRSASASLNQPTILTSVRVVTIDLPVSPEPILALTMPSITTSKGGFSNGSMWNCVRDYSAFKSAVDACGTKTNLSTASNIAIHEANTSSPGSDSMYESMVLGQLGRLYRLSDAPEPEGLYGELAQGASENILATQVNVLEFLSDLRHPQELALKFSNLGKLKTYASNYLAVEFGILPTISDIESIIGSFKHHGHSDRNGFHCAYSSRSESSVIENDIDHFRSYHLKLAVDREDQVFDNLCQRLESIGVFPTLSNLWDLLPYSFAIDWLVDVGGFLSSVDARQRLARLNVRYVTMSRKNIFTLQLTPTGLVPLSGQLQRVRYHRWVSGQCPVPPLSLQLTIKDFDHWLESSALIIQRRPH